MRSAEKKARYEKRDLERQYLLHCYKKPVERNKVGWPVLQGPFWKLWAKYKAKLGGD